MKMDKRRKFDQFYQAEYNSPFVLTEQLPVYCAADVRLLSGALIEYQKIFFEECNFDVLLYSTTIASACMQHYRANIMPEWSIGICDELSYETHGKQSTIARKYLKWYASQNNVGVRDVDSKEGELELIKGVFLDGFVKGGGVNGNDLAIEING